MIGRTLRKKLFKDLARHPVEQPEHAQAVLAFPRRFVRGGVVQPALLPLLPLSHAHAHPSGVKRFSARSTLATSINSGLR